MLKEVAQACLSLFMSKCHNVGNYMLRLIYHHKMQKNLLSLCQARDLAVFQSRNSYDLQTPHKYL